jgi:precorrin-4/cobalt-precorrin-4 C11-methyltransferase
MKGRIFFIGAGPGDPELLTLRGARALSECHTVFAATPYEETFALLLQGKKVLVPFDFYFQELCRAIDEFLLKGSVAFLVPGDLTFYSPFQPLVEHFGDDAVVIPGVGTANAASAILKRTFDLSAVCSRAIITSPRTLGDDPQGTTIADLAAPGAALLIYMNNTPLPQLVEQLKKGYGRSVPIAIFHRLCLPGEAVVAGTLDDIVERVGGRDFFQLSQTNGRPALSLVVVGETLASKVDGSWWDFRREHIWQHQGS